MSNKIVGEHLLSSYTSAGKREATGTSGRKNKLQRNCKPGKKTRQQAEGEGEHHDSLGEYLTLAVIDPLGSLRSVTPSLGSGKRSLDAVQSLRDEITENAKALE